MYKTVSEMTKSIDSIKVDIIQIVSSLSDIEELSRIANALRRPAKRSIFQMEPVNLDRTPDFDSVYAAQGGKSIRFEDLPPSTDDWGLSLEEVLAAL